MSADARPDTRTFVLQIITLVVGIIGGVLGYFFIYQPLTALDVGLKQSELDKQTTPVLGVTAIPLARDASDKLKMVTVDVLLENLGTAPVQLESVSIGVDTAMPNARLLEVFERNKKMNLFAPAPTPPAPATDAPSNKPTTNVTSDQSNQADEKIKLIQMIGSDGLDWGPSDIKAKTRKLEYRLLPGQKRSVQFEFIVWEEDPTWYRFVVYATPHDDSWRQIEVHVVVPCGPMPTQGYTIAKPVYETRVSYPSEIYLSPPPSAPPIPR